jgi:outer membrane protein OmpA-like peptidoglycan-associated protein
MEVLYLGERDLASDTQTVISQLIRRQAAIADLDVSYQRIAEVRFRIPFALGSATPGRRAKEALDRAGRVLAKHSSLAVHLTSYVESGESRRNGKLAEERAIAVRLLLLDRWHIDPARIIMESGKEPRRAVTIALAQLLSPSSAMSEGRSDPAGPERKD